MNIHGSMNTGSAVRPISPKSYVRIKKCHANELMHYGVSGMKWGVTTKEYEPVAVDHRKTGNRAAVRFGSRVRQAVEHKARQAKVEEAREWKQAAALRERRARNLKIAAYGGAALLGLAAVYGGYRYVKVSKAKAYSGILTRFLNQNPGSNLHTESGRQLFNRGTQLARENSRHFVTADKTNAYLKRTGLGLDRKRALRIYSARNLMKRSANIRDSGSKWIRKVNEYRRSRMNRRMLDKLYF